MSYQRSERRSYLFLVTGLALASNMAFGQNWVSSTSASGPVIPFNAPITGWINATKFAPKVPLYTCRGGSAEGLGVQVGKYTPGGTGCDIGYGGAEITVPDFEFLVMSWQSATGGFVPPNAVQGGQELIAGTTATIPLYYCRGELRFGSLQRPPSGPSSLQLGKIRPGLGGCVVPYSGTEFTLAEYDVLVSLEPAMPLATVPAINGFVPQDAIQAGIDADGTPLYVCSAFLNGSTYPGKLHSSFGGCNISVAGVEHTISNYFVLRPDWLGIPNYDFPAGTDVDGSPLHVCRAFLSTGLYPGKKRQPWTTCNVGLDGAEQAATTFEILSH